MSVRETYRLLLDRLERGPVAAATVVRTKGSTPREVGAKMIVDPGHSWGTIGGGCGEAEAVALARHLLAGGRPVRRMVRVDLTEKAWETSDRICGGIMDVLIECWTERGADLDAVAERDDLVRATPLDDRPAWFWTPERGTEGSGCPDAGVDAGLIAVCEDVWRTGRSRTDDEGGTEHFFELVSAKKTLIICGAGHIAEPLASMAALLDFSVIVIDDRPDFARRDRFPAAHRVIASPFVEALASLEITKSTLAVLVTRGHRHDEACLRELLRTEVSYIGMLGSRRRVSAILAELRGEGVPPADLDRIWAPIGLDIGANTPGEIAVSILAEIISLHRGGNLAHLRRGRSAP